MNIKLYDGENIHPSRGSIRRLVWVYLDGEVLAGIVIDVVFQFRFNPAYCLHKIALRPPWRVLGLAQSPEPLDE